MNRSSHCLQKQSFLGLMLLLLAWTLPSCQGEEDPMVKLVFERPAQVEYALQGPMGALTLPGIDRLPNQ